MELDTTGNRLLGREEDSQEASQVDIFAPFHRNKDIPPEVDNRVLELWGLGLGVVTGSCLRSLGFFSEG